MALDATQPSTRTSFPKHKIRVLLLENIHPTAGELLGGDGLSLEVVDRALNEDELCAKLKTVHLLGIRSKTRVTPKVLASAPRLLSVGCFCIGTNQVDLEEANRRGVVVFNAPFENTRSVAELVIAEIIALSRKLGDRSRDMHVGKWTKSARGSYEVRGKTLGIVGYGHIGRQVGVLAEAMGLKVLFYDIRKQLPMGNNLAVSGLNELLGLADFVTLHVPDTTETRGMMGSRQFEQMKAGSYLLNLSRGHVVDIDQLAQALASQHLAGAAVDVFPSEPQSNAEQFASPLCGLPNVILTPHVGGSTQEAQAAIGREVATTLLRFLNQGSTVTAVNFPQLDPPSLVHRHRILNMHRNVPGVLSHINTIVSNVQANVESQILATDPNVGYLVMDLDRGVSDDVKRQMSQLPTNIRTRILY